MAYHFIGIKGTGMASLATILFDENKEVNGSDMRNIYLHKMNWKKEVLRLQNLMRITSKITIRQSSDCHLIKRILK